MIHHKHSVGNILLRLPAASAASQGSQLGARACGWAAPLQGVRDPGLRLGRDPRRGRREQRHPFRRCGQRWHPDHPRRCEAARATASSNRQTKSHPPPPLNTHSTVPRVIEISHGSPRGRDRTKRLPAAPAAAATETPGGASPVESAGHCAKARQPAPRSREGGGLEIVEKLISI
jgi:hypothetical protein